MVSEKTEIEAIDSYIADLWLPLWQKRLSALRGEEVTEEATRAYIMGEARYCVECGRSEEEPERQLSRRANSYVWKVFFAVALGYGLLGAGIVALLKFTVMGS